MPQIITLIGMPGVGKSTIGKLLADRLNFGFLDLDSLIQKTARKTLAEIINHQGEEALLRLEEDCALALDFPNYIKPEKGLVFAPGGSIVYSEKAMSKLKEMTAVVFLDLPFLELKRRLESSLVKRGIVGIAKKSLEEIFKERLPLYRLAADHVVNCYNLTDEKIIDQIYEKML